MLILGLKDIVTINHSDIYDTYMDFFLSKKEREERLLQSIQPANGLKAQVSAEKAEDGTALTFTTQENAIKKMFGKRFAIPLDFDFFKHHVYPYDLKKDLIVRLELNLPGKVILCTEGASAKYKLSDISLEHDAILDEAYDTAIGSIYNSGALIPYTKVELIHYHTLKKRHYLED